MERLKSYINELKSAGFELVDIKEILMSTVRVDVSPLQTLRDAEELELLFKRLVNGNEFGHS